MFCHHLWCFSNLCDVFNYTSQSSSEPLWYIFWSCLLLYSSCLLWFSHEGYSIYTAGRCYFLRCFFSMHPRDFLLSSNNTLGTLILHPPLLLSFPLPFHWSNALSQHWALQLDFFFLFVFKLQPHQSIFHKCFVLKSEAILNPPSLWQSCSPWGFGSGSKKDSH